MSTINIKSISGRTILSGSPYGRTFLAELISRTQPAAEVVPLILDFSDIEVATGSFLRTAVLGYRDYCINLSTNLVPVVANLNAEMKEELALILNFKGDAIVSCLAAAGNVLSNAEILGALEEKQRTTLEIVLREGKVNAVDLEKRYWEQEKIQATAWNNRLTSLVKKGILVEIRKGRQKFYRPVLEVEKWELTS